MLHDLVTVDDLVERYHMERHSAARMMRVDLPSFKVGKRLFCRAEYLKELEENRTVYPMPTKTRRR